MHLCFEDGHPARVGSYVVYTDDTANPVRAVAAVLIWSLAGWFYPGTNKKYTGRVHGYIGPLPILKLSQATNGAKL